MQRLFAMFPSGAPGFALLLLRLSVAAPLILQACQRSEQLPGWLVAGALLLSGSLVVGCLTPIAAVVAIGMQLLAPLGLSVTDHGFLSVLVLNALALALLGPGAYSFDSLRFGRQVLKLPPDREE